MSKALIVLLASLCACGSGRSEQEDRVPPELMFENLEFHVYRGPELTAYGEAMHASFRRDTSGLSAEQVTVRFPPTAARAAARITAATGSGNVRERRFTATGGIRAEQAGQVATTSEARYSAADGLVRGDHPVEIRESRLTVRGPGFTLDPKDQSLHLEGGASAVAGGRELR